MTMERLDPVPCQICATPVAEVGGGIMVIVARHHGVKHTTVLKLESAIVVLPNGTKLNLTTGMPE